MGWSDPRLGALPLGLVRALHSCMLKRAVLTDQDFAQCLLWGATLFRLVPQWARGYEEKPTPVVHCFRFPISSSVRSAAEQVTNALSNLSARRTRNGISQKHDDNPTYMHTISNRITPFTELSPQQATYQPSYLEGIGGRDGFVAAFYACAALMYRMTSIPMAAGCQPVVHLGGVMVALLGNTNAA